MKLFSILALSLWATLVATLWEYSYELLVWKVGLSNASWPHKGEQTDSYVINLCYYGFLALWLHQKITLMHQNVCFFMETKIGCLPN
jgi:hypothetical protein